MKTVAKAVAFSALAVVGSQALAYEIGNGFEASANVGAVSNYMWRGTSQTSNEAAVQGGVDLTHSSGAYLGTWVSNVDFDLAPDADTEQDFYAGYGFTLGDFAFDLKRTEYHYASANALDFGETHVHVSAYGATIGADYSSDTPIANSDSALHYYASYSYTLPQEIGLTATIGQYDFKDAGWVGSEDSKYSYYNVGVNKEYWGVNFGLAYTDSNVDKDNCEVFYGADNNCGGSFVLSAVKTFK